MMTLLYVGLVCATVLIVVSTITSAVTNIKKHAAEKRAEVDRRQIESAFPPEKPEPVSLQQQAFDEKRLARLAVFNAKKQALDHLLERRSTLESQIAELRTKIQAYADKSYTQYRNDAISALSDARKEQQELVGEQEKLLATMDGDDDAESQVDATSKPVRVDTGGPVAGRVDDPDLLHDAEPDEPEASRTSAA